MRGNERRSNGLRLTLRHLMIAVAYFAILFAWAGPLAKGTDEGAGYAIARVVLLASPWLLAGLVLAFDVPGPARGWTVANLLFAFYPSLVVFLDLGVVLDCRGTGVCPPLGGLAAVNGFTAAAALVFYRRMWRARCPSCGQRSLIPLVRLSGQSRRSQGTRWCASCGGQYWRDRLGVWRVERRTTWVGASRTEPLPVSPTTPDRDAPPIPAPAASASRSAEVARRPMVRQAGGRS